MSAPEGLIRKRQISVPPPPARLRRVTPEPPPVDLQALGIPADAVPLARIPERVGQEGRYSFDVNNDGGVRPRQAIVLPPAPSRLPAPAPLPVAQFEPTSRDVSPAPLPQLEPRDDRPSRGREFFKYAEGLFQTAAQSKVDADERAEAEGRPAEPSDWVSALARNVTASPSISVPPPPGHYGQGVASPQGESVTRERFADRPAWIEEELARRQADPSRPNSNSRGWGMVKVGLHRVREALANGGGLVDAAGAFVGGAGAGAFDKSLDERLGEQESSRRLAGELKMRRAAEVAGLERAGKRADIAYRNEVTDYSRTAKRDDLESKALDREARREQAEQRALLARLRTMPRVDPQLHGEFLAEWEKRFGERFDVDGYNNKKGNIVIRGLITDPKKPQEKRDVAINFATGERKDLGPSGYVTPLDEVGLSANQRETIEDRRKLLPARLRQIELGIATREKELSSGIPASAARSFSVANSGLAQQLAQKRTEIARLRKSAEEMTSDPVEASARADALEVEANAILARMETLKAQTLGGGAGSPAPGRSSTAPVGRVSRKKFDGVRAQNPALRNASDAEVEAALKARGIEVY